LAEPRLQPPDHVIPAPRYCGLAFSNLKLSLADIAAGFQSRT